VSTPSFSWHSLLRWAQPGLARKHNSDSKLPQLLVSQTHTRAISRGSAVCLTSDLGAQEAPCLPTILFFPSTFLLGKFQTKVECIQKAFTEAQLHICHFWSVDLHFCIFLWLVHLKITCGPSWPFTPENFSLNLLSVRTFSSRIPHRIVTISWCLISSPYSKFPQLSPVIYNAPTPPTSTPQKNQNPGSNQIPPITFDFWFFFFLVVLGFEPRASCWLVRHPLSYSTSPTYTSTKLMLHAKKTDLSPFHCNRYPFVWFLRQDLAM
jgi:hypothetical protein